MKIAFFGSSLVSTWWNGAATYYRGLLKALAARGHEITFYEPDALDRQKHRDMADPDWARVVVYRPEDWAARDAVADAEGAELVVKASGVGVLDELLESEVLGLQSDSTIVAFWDVDAPATLERMETHRHDPFRRLVGRYDYVFTYGGGQPVVQRYTALGARRCVPIYNALDPDTHHPCDREERFSADLAFLGNRLPDRERRVEEFFLAPARQLPHHNFLLGGNGWQDKPMPANVRYAGHVYTRDHNAFNCTPLATLNISRDSMASNGWSPATRVFEAAGAGACIISDAWRGLEDFLLPGTEILVARSGEEVVELMDWLTPEKAARIGAAARKHILSEHTYAHRAELVEQVLQAQGAMAK